MTGSGWKKGSFQGVSRRVVGVEEVGGGGNQIEAFGHRNI